MQGEPFVNQYLVLLTISLAAMRKSRWASVTVVASVALVVFVLQGFLAMTVGFAQTARNTGADDIAVVLDSQATSETSSSLTREQVEIIRSLVTSNREGHAGLSAELSMIVGGIRADDRARINLTMRGLEANGVQLHRGFRLVEGRMPAPLSREVIVGRRLAGEIEDATVGKVIRLGGSDWKTVGVFALDGNLFESEIWANLASVQDAFNRSNQYQSIRIRVSPGGPSAELLKRNGADPRLGLQMQSEHEYLKAQASSGVFLVQYFGWPLSMILAIGVVAGIYNIMQISIEGRARELLILRLMGIDGWPLFASLLSEAVLLALAGAVLGSLGAYLVLDGAVTSALGVGFGTRTFSLAVDLRSTLDAFLMAVAVGLVSAVVPSWKGAGIEH
jgi:putative ABC transport system permease protein